MCIVIIKIYSICILIDDEYYYRFIIGEYTNDITFMTKDNTIFHVTIIIKFNGSTYIKLTFFLYTITSPLKSMYFISGTMNLDKIKSP